MNNIYDCVDSFTSLLDIEYHLILGRKGVLDSLQIVFNKKDCFHLMGLQYLTDRPNLSRDRGKVFDEIKSRITTVKQIESSDFYYKIKDRVGMPPRLECIFDSNDTIFKYNQKKNVFSLIQADYLMQNRVENKNIYLFLSKNKDEQYFCRSFFPEGKMNYTKNQASWTLLYKKKIKVSTQEEVILYDRLKNVSSKKDEL